MQENKMANRNHLQESQPPKPKEGSFANIQNAIFI